MAKQSQIARNNKRKKLSDKFSSLRKELKKQIIDINLSDEERFMAQVKLQKLPRDSSKARFRNRCELTGRSRGFYRAFKLSRIKFRELAHQGMLPGVTKSSW